MYNLVIIIPAVFVTSCSIGGSLQQFAEDDLPVSVSAYNYETNKPAKVKINMFEDYDFKINTKSFYVKRSFTLPNKYIEMGNAFHENEERREAERYLTLR